MTGTSLEGRALLRALERRGLSARALAREANVSPSTVCRAIKGKGGISRRKITVITKALDRFDVLPLIDDFLPALADGKDAAEQQTFDF